MNQTILVIKPEAVHSLKEVVDLLTGLGYVCGEPRHRRGWRSLMSRMYTEFPPAVVEDYRRLYDQHGIGDDFVVLPISGDYDTLTKIAELKGHFRSYQESPATTLRGRWGRSADFNKVSDRFILVLNGFHAPVTAEELRENELLFGVHVVDSENGP